MSGVDANIVSSPYFWKGDELIYKTGRVVATVDDFPQLKRQINVGEKMRERMYPTPEKKKEKPLIPRLG